MTRCSSAISTFAVICSVNDDLALTGVVVALLLSVGLVMSFCTFGLAGGVDCTVGALFGALTFFVRRGDPGILVVDLGFGSWACF